ncbi:MAG: flagellar hook-length control protein FliK [Lachnospiraceae bacterium]|nr:flagellar hook-length control protein FliK [Lachnospiraceae bacterium]
MNLSSNRIQQNAARNNRPAPNRPAGQKPPVAQANTLSNYGTTTRVRSLYVGQVLKGEVSDLRNREIVLTLENNTTVSAHLEGGNWLAIGEISAFKVLSASPEQITLEALPRTDMALANSTVQKALEEAGLPKNPKNQQIVLELMKNQLPIHKQSILQMLQKSFQYQEVSVPTLVLMSKHQIPITTQNAIQFERYQNNAHSLATGLENLAKDLSSMIRDLATTLSDVNDYIEVSNMADSSQDSLLHQTTPNSPQNQVLQQLFQHTAQPSATTANNTMQTTVSRILSAILDSNSFVSETPLEGNQETAIGSLLPDQTLEFLKESDRTELVSILENFDLPDTLREGILDGTASLRQVNNQLQKNYEQAMVLDRESQSVELSENEISSENITNTAHSKENEFMHRTAFFDNPIIKELESQLQNLQNQTHEIGSRFSMEERLLLKEYLQDFPIDNTIKEQISNGSIKQEDFLRIIKNVLPFTEKETATPLLSSQLLSSLVEDTFLENFFLTPKEIFSQGGVNTYYRRLSKQLENLDSLFEKNLHAKTSSNIQQITNALSIEPKEQVSQLKDNLDFMKLLNQFFSYVQLPTKLQEKITHADLYVYTRKKNLKQQQNPIRVLLHLNMDNLGDLDIQVNLKNRDVTSIFHTENDKVGKLLSNNFSLLEETLGNLGYTCTNQIAKLEKKVDIVNDFIAPESAGHSISRYSFDLRA